MPKGVQVARQADLMHQGNGSHRIIKDVLNSIKVEVESAAVNVREHRDTAGQHQAVHRRHAGVSRHDHFVARLQSGDLKRQMESTRSRIDSYRMWRAYQSRHFSLEFLDLRPLAKPP